VKKLIFLGLAGVAVVAAGGAVVVARLTAPPDPAPEGPGSVAAPAAAAPVSFGPLPGAAHQGPRYLALPSTALDRDLAAATRPCHGRFRLDPGAPPVFTLELEAEQGRSLVVVDARVESAGGASEGLMLCLRERLPGQRVAGGSFPAGERFLIRYVAQQEVERPPPTVPQSPADHPAPQSISRQPASRRAGGR